MTDLLAAADLNFPPTHWLLFMRDQKEFSVTLGYGLAKRQVGGSVNPIPPPICLSTGRLLVKTWTVFFFTSWHILIFDLWKFVIHFNIYA
ncbi:hypothetical protein XELAEV_18031538mg [Xenopus laevis]|uniref:Uncharacterized protein n=1 Tax=Xenopus laevis TaxID=8355 RepID=A0A974HFT6_XENLA|nr:hypothetical protein XELAEV_18031538mg [Xenopus laevis]